MENNKLEIFGLTINITDSIDEKRLRDIISRISKFEKECGVEMNKEDRISSFKIIGKNATLNFAYTDGHIDTYVNIKSDNTSVDVRNMGIDTFFKIYTEDNMSICFDRMKNYKKLENIKLYSINFEGVKEDLDER